MSSVSDRLRKVADALPDNASVSLPVSTIREWLASESPREAIDVAAVGAVQVDTWRARLWLVDPSTRLGVREAAEALGRPRSFIYRHTTAKCASAERLPCRRLNGELVFVAGELRTWLEQHEEIINRAPRALRSA
jgi:predicted DNA-binding transcriptional regulator AlpA